MWLYLKINFSTKSLMYKFFPFREKSSIEKSAIKSYFLFRLSLYWNATNEHSKVCFRKIPRYFAREKVSNSFPLRNYIFTNYVWKNVIFNSLTIKFLLLCKTIWQCVTNDNVPLSLTVTGNCITLIRIV